MKASEPSVLSKRIQQVAESETLKLNALVNTMKAEGKTVFNLTAGEPDFAPPESAKQAIVKALERNESKYTPVPGIQKLREAVARKTNLQQPSLKTPWTANEVCVSNGGKQVIYNAFQCLLNPGDEVVFGSPYWLSYPDMVKLAEGCPIPIQTERSNRGKVTPKDLEKVLTSRTKMLILNSPSNPSGVMYTAKELSDLAVVLRKHPHVWVLSDEIYDQIILGQVPFVSFLETCPDLRDRVITVNGMSKSYAMTGWRIGWAVARKDLIQGMITLQGQSTSGINSLAQWASLAALDLPVTALSEHVKEYCERRSKVLEVLKKSKKIDCVEPDGAFYVWVYLDRVLGPNQDARSFSERLLHEAGVAVVPGGSFGDSRAVRISFATDRKTIQEGCERFVQFIEKISP